MNDDKIKAAHHLLEQREDLVSGIQNGFGDVEYPAMYLPSAHHCKELNGRSVMCQALATCRKMYKEIMISAAKSHIEIINSRLREMGVRPSKEHSCD